MSLPSEDREGRFRDKTTGFRVSGDEEREINSLVALSGMRKQDYLISRALCRDISVTPTIRVQKVMALELHAVARELARLSDASEVGIRLQETAETIVELLRKMSEAGMAAENGEHGLKEEELADLRLVLPPEERRAPVTPDQVAPIKRRRKVPKGIFKG